MLLKLNLQKAIEAAGVLLEFESTHQMDKLRLLKLLYIADRQLIRETGKPLLGSRVVAMQHGPAHSEVLNLINGTHIAAGLWESYFHLSGYSVQMVRQPERGELSPCEIEKLRRISEDQMSHDTFDVVDLTHTFPEWQNTYQPGTSTEIPIEAILAAVGRDHLADEIKGNAKAVNALDRLLGG